ncbi:MAG: germination lipoprotein GerS [Terrisporobacter sp.]|uniref:germination lipoprotein GerS n=1 Tax=Terrisporobacter sp. TaxID=1965305 RepID=UPI0025E314E4|nr:germination lipoprotein GerS [uncultured Terrisporobacter sp.]
MKNKWSILLSSFITMIFVFTVGCTNKEYTADELYEDFKDQISKVSSYTCIAKVEAIGNKENTTYIFKHTYKKPDYYKLEVKSPKNLKGKTIEYKNNKIIINNPNINDTVEFKNINNDARYLFIGDFINNYRKDENTKLELTENELKIEVKIPGNNKYFNKQILYVNNKTKTPDKMEIVDNEENPRFIVTYEGFKYNK